MGFWLSRDRLVTNVPVALALESETALAPTPVFPVVVTVGTSHETEAGTAASFTLGSTGIDEPLPAVNEFESNMTTYGHDTATGVNENDPDLSYYYDFAWGSRQINQWLGVTSTWTQRENDAIIAFTTDRFNDASATYPYALGQAWWCFPHGLYYHWLNGGAHASRALEYLLGYTNQASSAFNYPYPKADAGESPGWPNKDYWAGYAYSRETAYWIQAHIYREKAGGSRKTLNGEPYLARYVNFAANQLRQWRNNDFTLPGDGAGDMRVFMLFLTLYALTELVDWSRATGQDENQWWPYPNWQAVNLSWPIVQWPTVVDAIVDMTTWVFDTALTRDGTNRRMWVADDGTGYGSFRYTDRTVQGVGSPNPAPDLSLLCVPVFGWVGKETNDPTMFTQRGDHVWEGGVRNAYLTTAKVFNQNYLKSFDYVTFRETFGA